MLNCNTHLYAIRLGDVTNVSHHCQSNVHNVLYGALICISYLGLLEICGQSKKDYGICIAIVKINKDMKNCRYIVCNHVIWWCTWSMRHKWNTFFLLIFVYIVMLQPSLWSFCGKTTKEDDLATKHLAIQLWPTSNWLECLVRCLVTSKNSCQKHSDV